MKTLNINHAEKQSDEAKPKLKNRMEAIACGVQARFEESTGYSKKVTDETVNVARSLGVSNSEIERWASRRMNRITHDTARLQEIKSLLKKVYGDSFSTAARTMRG